MLSKDCEGCSKMMFECKQRFRTAKLWEKVYCADGTAHLIDS
jgi:hypothetical protein